MFGDRFLRQNTTCIFAHGANQAGTGTTGATLSGTTTRTPTNGVVAFSGLSIDLPGSGYVLVASSAGLTAAESSAIAVLAVPTKLAFTTQPAASVGAGATFATAPVVTVQDSSSNTVATAALDVTLEIQARPGRCSPGRARAAP